MTVLRTLTAEYTLDADATARVQTSENPDDSFVEFTASHCEPVWLQTVESVENLIKILQEKLPEIKETFYATSKDAAR